ncbi:MAG: L,D-transpeptidase family protein [bacterium]
MSTKIKIFLLIFLFAASPVFAEQKIDTDRDGVPDIDETEVYHTDPYKEDTDGDGYNDWVELNAGFSPFTAYKLKLKDSDYDKDGLSDRMEFNFHTDPTNPDTDEDGFKDGIEINNGFNPADASPSAKLDKKISVSTAEQKLNYFLGGVRMGEFPVSTGKSSMPTPKGTFSIGNKSTKAWSKSYGLWMPYWMGIQGKNFGLHELPEWPNGYKEGADHLGKPVSHGCIRLGVGPAKTLFDWAEVGTDVYIY